MEGVSPAAAQPGDQSYGVRGTAEPCFPAPQQRAGVLVQVEVDVLAHLLTGQDLLHQAIEFFLSLADQLMQIFNEAGADLLVKEGALTFIKETLIAQRMKREPGQEEARQEDGQDKNETDILCLVFWHMSAELSWGKTHQPRLHQRLAEWEYRYMHATSNSAQAEARQQRDLARDALRLAKVNAPISNGHHH